MLKEIAVISGKGGTGKTSIVAALANLLNNKVLADCDVDAADLHLVLNPIVQEEHEFWCGKTAVIDPDICTSCNKCIELCRFEAISPDFIVDGISCEGCGVCAYFCPSEAISLQDNLSGYWSVSKTEYGPLVHARLKIAEENSGLLVSLVKNKAREIATEENKDFILIDGSPGIGCPVIASISGTDFILVVTEPTLSGLHDLNRVLALAQHFDITTAVCINKSDINQEMTENILKNCQEKQIPVLGVIPYDNAITKAQIQGKSIVDFAPNSPTAKIIRTMKDNLINLISQER